MGFDESFKKVWSRGRKIDPLSHKALEAVMKMDSKGVRETSRGLSKVFGGDRSWLGSRFNDLGDEADKNVNDPARGIGRAAATVGLGYGAYAAAGAAGGGAAAGAGEGAAVTGGGAGLAEAGGGAALEGSMVEGTMGTASGGEYAGLQQAAGGQGFSPQFQRLMQMRGGQQQPAPSRWQNVETEENPWIDDIALSSKAVKRPAKNVDEAIDRGARLDNPIDAIGVQTAAIKALAQRFARIAQAQGAPA